MGGEGKKGERLEAVLVGVIKAFLMVLDHSTVNGPSFSAACAKCFSSFFLFLCQCCLEIVNSTRRQTTEL